MNIPAPPTDHRYDAIVVGAGAAGGVVACLLAEAGKRVLLLDRGKRYATWDDVSRDHLRNHRLALYGHNTGPELLGNPRVFVDRRGAEHVVKPHQGGYHNNAMAVGGGTLVYGAQAWRFMPDDFRMASRYGSPAGSSLADWPVTYEELERHYDRAEWELGVAGDARAMKLHGARQRGFPMPPVEDNPERLLLRDAAGRLGWVTHPVPLAINTVPYNGRPACVRCGACVGFACPSDGKNGTQNTVIPRALATGNCTLVAQAQAERIDTDDRGDAVGVTYIVDDGSATPRRIAARAKVIVSSAGAIESARLLLNSASRHHPRGIGNESDHVGRHLQGHYYPGAFGTVEQSVYDGFGPGVSIATTQFNHGNPGIVGGGMLANEFLKIPVIFWKGQLPPDLPRWGIENKRFMRENFHRVMQVTGPVQEIPSPDSRASIDPAVRDRYGIPVVRLSGTTHPETLRTALFMRDRAQEWLRAAGATKVWSNPVELYLSGGQHQAGTCRMSRDPRDGVTDPFGRVHAHDNLYVIDGSLHVTNGGFNPFLTIMALAYRCGEHIGRS